MLSSQRKQIRKVSVYTQSDLGILSFEMPANATVESLKLKLQRKFVWPSHEFLLKAWFPSGKVRQPKDEELIINDLFTLEKYSTSLEMKYQLEYLNCLLINGEIRHETKIPIVEEFPHRFVAWSPFTKDKCDLLIKFIEFTRNYHDEKTSADVKIVMTNQQVAVLGGTSIYRCLNGSFPNHKRMVLSYMRAGCGPVQIQNGKRFIEIPLNYPTEYSGGQALTLKHNILHRCSDKMPGTISDIKEENFYGRTNILSGVYYSMYISVDQMNVNVHSSSKSIVYYCSNELFDSFCINQVK